jgi:hypothetical protein
MLVRRSRYCGVLQPPKMYALVEPPYSRAEHVVQRNSKIIMFSQKTRTLVLIAASDNGIDKLRYVSGA